MGAVVRVIRVSGFSLDACVAVVQRHDGDAHRPRYLSDYFLVERRDRDARVTLQTRVPLEACRLTEGGDVFVVGDDGSLWHREVRASRGFERHTVGKELNHVWTLGSTRAFAAGRDANGHPMIASRREGVWSSVPCDHEVWAVHGADEDSLCAVGAAGFLARWDGNAWAPMERVTAQPLTAIFVEHRDLAWACGPQGVVLEGSTQGWMPRAETRALLSCVARFQGEVVLGAGPRGLVRLVGDGLADVDPAWALRGWRPMSLDARASLLLACGDALVATDDLSRFDAWPTSEIAALLP